MTVSYKPLRNDLLVEFIRPEKTKEGLHLPDGATFGDAWPRARVLAIAGVDFMGEGVKVNGVGVGDVLLVNSERCSGVRDRIGVAPWEAVVCLVEGHSDDDVMAPDPMQEPSVIVPPTDIVQPNRQQRRALQGRRH